jgi:hypothetical protein
MILTPEEQLEYREEIDYLIETRGYEYIWGKETAIDKTKGLLRDAPGKIIDGLNKIATNPTVISINEKLAAHNAKLNAESQGKSQSNPMDSNMLGGIGSGSGFGGMPQAPMRSQQQYSHPKTKRHKPRRKSEPCDDYQGNDIYFNNHPRDDNPLGSNPLGEHPFSKKDRTSGGLNFGGEHL